MEIHKIALYDHREGVVVQPGAGGTPNTLLFFEKTATWINAACTIPCLGRILSHICVLFVPYFYGRVYKII